MKPKAIISLFNHLQNEALRQFLMMHKPMTVISCDLGKNPFLKDVAAGAGCDVVLLEALQSASDIDLMDAEVAARRQAFAQYLQAQEDAAHIPRQLTSVLSARLDADLQKSMLLLGGLELTAEQYDIGLFVTDEDITGPKKLATAWAKSRGIPSLHFSHSIFLLGAYTVHDQLIADKVAVYGDRAKEAYFDLGYSDDRMIVTGNLTWDAYGGLRNKKPLCRDGLNQKYELDPGLPLVVFGTTWASNFTAHAIETIYEDSLRAFISACEDLLSRGFLFNAVIKDRWMNREFGQQKVHQILAEFGGNPESYCFAMDDTQLFAAAADVLVAVDSNYLVEGMLARTPCINLINTTGTLMGPCFEAETGILEAEPHELAQAISLLLTDKETRDRLVQMGSQRAGYYNFGDSDGMASDRLVQAMKIMSRNLPSRMESEIPPIFLMGPTSRLGVQYGFGIVKAYGNVIAAIDDTFAGEYIHGVPRWSSEKFKEQAGLHAGAVSINLAVSDKGKAWVEGLCQSAGVQYLDFEQAEEKFGTLPRDRTAA